MVQSVYQPTLLLEPEQPLLPGICVAHEDPAGAKELIGAWKRCKAFGFDIETYGLSDDAPLDPWLGRIRLIQVGLPDGRSLIADLGGWDDDREALNDVLSGLGFWETLKERLFCRNTFTVGHNLKFDLGWVFKLYGYRANKCADTMILSQIYWAGIQPYRHSLKDVAARLGFDVDKSQQKSAWGEKLTTNQLNYAATDVQVVLKMWRMLGKLCLDEGLKNTAIAEMAALPAFAEMEIRGFPVNRERLDELLVEYQEAHDLLAAPFAKLFPDASVDDHKKLPRLLKERLGIEVDKADKDALNPHRHIAEISSLLSTRSIGAYIDYLKNIERSYRDGRVRGGYRQCAPAGRGRSTSGSGEKKEAGQKDKPSRGIPSLNLQNPPNPSKACAEVAALDLPPVREVFQAPPGKKLLVVDLSAAHARIAVQVIQEPALIASYLEDLDIHGIVASKLSELIGKNWSQADIEKVRKQKDAQGEPTADAALATKCRNTAKNVYYGWQNGAGKAKTAETVRVAGFQADDEFAAGLIDLLRARFPKVAEFHERIKKQLKTNQKEFPGTNNGLKYTPVVDISGRRVWLPVWPKSDNNHGGAKPTDAYMCNWMGVEATSVKTAMHLIREAEFEHPEWGLELINNCHDELNCLVNEEFAEEAGYVVWASMQAALGQWVTVIPAYAKPYAADDVVCDTWSEK